MDTIQELLDHYKQGISERVKSFKMVCNDELKNPKVQPGSPTWNGTTTYPNGKPITWCNLFVYNVLERLGISMMNYYAKNKYTGVPDKDWTDINSFFVHLKTYGTAVDFKYAQNFAKYGVPIVVIQPAQGQDVGHVGLVYPDDTIQNDKNDVAIVNAGSKEIMGIHSAYDCFYKWGYNPSYFHLS